MDKLSPLHEIWEAQGADFTRAQGWRLASRIAGPEVEYAAARKAVSLIDLSSRGKIRITGSDRIDVLHRLLTNDLQSLRPGQGCYAAFLTAQGRVIADMHVYIFEESILLDLETGLAGKAIERLEKFIITEDVQMEDASAEFAHIRIQGPGAEMFLSEFLSLPVGTMRGHDHVTVKRAAAELIRRRNAAEGFYEVLLSEKQAAGFVEELLEKGFDAGLQPAGLETAEILRIEDGMLRYGIDFNEDIALPETGLDLIAASPAKGCYPGQEVVARMNTYKGHTKKMVGFLLEGSTVPAHGDKVLLEDKEIGWITSSCFSPGLGKAIALGYVAKGFFDSAAGGRILSGTKGLQAGIISLPFPSHP